MQCTTHHRREHLGILLMVWKVWKRQMQPRLTSQLRRNLHMQLRLTSQLRSSLQKQLRLTSQQSADAASTDFAASQHPAKPSQFTFAASQQPAEAASTDFAAAPQQSADAASTDFAASQHPAKPSQSTFAASQQVPESVPPPVTPRNNDRASKPPRRDVPSPPLFEHTDDGSQMPETVTGNIRQLRISDMFAARDTGSGSRSGSGSGNGSGTGSGSMPGCYPVVPEDVEMAGLDIYGKFRAREFYFDEGPPVEGNTSAGGATTDFELATPGIVEPSMYVTMFVHRKRVH